MKKHKVFMQMNGALKKFLFIMLLCICSLILSAQSQATELWTLTGTIDYFDDPHGYAAAFGLSLGAEISYKFHVEDTPYSVFHDPGPDPDGNPWYWHMEDYYMRYIGGSALGVMPWWPLGNLHFDDSSEATFYNIDVYNEDSSLSGFYITTFSGFSFENRFYGDGMIRGENMHITISNYVPEPTTILLFGTGLIGLVGIRRKKTKK